MDTEQRAKARAISDALLHARISEKYYGHRLAQAQRCSFALDLITAAASTATAVLLPFLQKGLSLRVLLAVACAAALLGAARPVIAFNQRIARLSRLVWSYKKVFHALEECRELVRIKLSVTDECWSDFGRAKGHLRAINGEDDPRPSRTLQKRCEREVHQEISLPLPSADFWATAAPTE